MRYFAREIQTYRNIEIELTPVLYAKVLGKYLEPCEVYFEDDGSLLPHQIFSLIAVKLLQLLQFLTFFKSS